MGYGVDQPGSGAARFRRAGKYFNEIWKKRAKKHVSISKSDGESYHNLFLSCFEFIILTQNDFYITLTTPPGPSFYLPFPLPSHPPPYSTMTIPLAASANAELPRPKDVGVLGMEVYFPRRVRDFGRLFVSFDLISHLSSSSVSPSPIWRCSMACPRENTPLVLARSTWHGPTTAKTSTPSL